MLSSRQTRRAQLILILVGLVLAGYYALVFRPLVRRAAMLDTPLQQSWRKLALARVSGTQADEPDLHKIESNLQQVEAAVRVVKATGESIQAAIALDATVLNKMREPFQLVDFQIEELLRIEELGRAAQQTNVLIAPAVFSNFPEFRADGSESELLWGQLAFLHQVLATAIRCNVTSIQNLELPAFIAHGQSTNTPAFLYEIPVRVEVVGSMESVSRLLASMPLRSGSKKVEGLPELTPTKPSLLIDRILLRKNSAEKPDEAHLDLRVCGFIYREAYKAK